MKKEDLFYAIFALTVFLIRLSIFIFPEHHIIIAGFLIHHFFIGIIFSAASCFAKNKNAKLFLFSIGIALMADELVFMALGGGLDKEYWSTYSFVGMLITSAIVFLLRKKIIYFQSRIMK